jgi:hypothetical protein
VKFGVNLILVISLSLITGKNCFVVNNFVVRCVCVCVCVCVKKAWNFVSFVVTRLLSY